MLSLLQSVMLLTRPDNSWNMLCYPVRGMDQNNRPLTIGPRERTEAGNLEKADSLLFIIDPKLIFRVHLFGLRG